ESDGAAFHVVDTPVPLAGQQRAQGFAHDAMVINDDNFRRYGRHVIREGKAGGGLLRLAAVYIAQMILSVQYGTCRRKFVARGNSSGRCANGRSLVCGSSS